MLLGPGIRLGPYEILAALGAGGMGEVYRARDTKLDRDVALKILPDAFTNDAERLARFQREARVLASLNHPNIAAIYGLEDSGGTQALVLELVEGPTLADRISQGPIPVDEALPITTQIAEALEAAHERGIIHRDLKPANIKVRPDGTVKVLDFGLAKAVVDSGEASQARTATLAETRREVILGTVPYMSPEQVRGGPVDQRSDVWAFGCVLFETLTGRATFPGRSTTEALAQILERAPAWEALPRQTPTQVRRLLERCLTKAPRNRLAHFGDARLELQDARTSPTSDTSTKSSAGPGERLVWAALLVAAVGLSALFWNTTPGEEPTRRFAVSVEPSDELVMFGLSLFFSPDDSAVFYSAVRDSTPLVFRRALDRITAQPVPGTEGATQPFISPGGEWIGFFADGWLRKVPSTGGTPIDVCQVSDPPHGAVWGATDTIIFGHHAEPLWQVAAAGGIPQPLTRLERGEVDHTSPSLVPDESAVLFQVISAGSEGVGVHIEAQSLLTGERRMLVEGSSPHVTETGHLVFLRGEALWAAPFDVSTLQIVGEALPVESDVDTAPNYTFDVSPSGSLAYLPATRQLGSDLRNLVWVDPSGQEASLPVPSGRYREPVVSPDGRHIAVSVASDRAGEWDVWVFDADTGAGLKLTDAGANQAPVWTPGGQRIVFSSDRDRRRPDGWIERWFGDLYSIAADGSGDLVRLASDGGNLVPTGISPDGRILFFTRLGTGMRQSEVLERPFDRPGDARVLLESYRQRSARPSPTGEWIAYTSRETGQSEVFMQAYPALGEKVPISIGGGEGPRWSDDGAELYYLAPEAENRRVMAVSLTHDDARLSPEPRLLFEGPYIASAGGTTHYDVGPGGRFLMMKASETGDEARPTRIHVVVNWHRELLERVPVP